MSTLGSIWLGWPDDAKITNTVARTAHVYDTRTVTSIPEILEANIGQPVALLVDDKWMDAIIRDIPMNDPGRDAPRTHIPRRSDLLILEGNEEITIVKTSSVQRVRFTKADVKMSTQVSRPTAHPVLDFTVVQPGKSRSVDVEYMASGIAWSPSYRVVIDDDTKTPSSPRRR